jgi:hypothetical protein
LFSIGGKDRLQTQADHTRSVEAKQLDDGVSDTFVLIVTTGSVDGAGDVRAKISL